MIVLDINILQYFLYDYIFFKELLLNLFLLINIGLLNLIFNYNDFIILLIFIEMVLFSIGLLFNKAGYFNGIKYPKLEKVEEEGPKPCAFCKNPIVGPRAFSCNKYAFLAGAITYAI